MRPISPLLKGETINHPFDSPQGYARLRAWLQDLDPENYSYAHNATVALVFIREPARSELLQLAIDNLDPRVSVEAAWVAAKIGQERGIMLLARFARDVNVSAKACHYLEELHRADAIPPEARDPDFEAMAAMVHWLSHPREFGKPPDAIELYDTREIFWPPTEDRRQVWLFKYRYLPGGRRKKEDVNLGMVGGVTMSLFGESLPTADPVDAYALHCCWELQVRENPRAPKERTVELGRKILAEHNPAL